MPTTLLNSLMCLPACRRTLIPDIIAPVELASATDKSFIKLPDISLFAKLEGSQKIPIT
jgi:hypothetical protein